MGTNTVWCFYTGCGSEADPAGCFEKSANVSAPFKLCNIALIFNMKRCMSFRYSYEILLQNDCSEIIRINRICYPFFVIYKIISSIFVTAELEQNSIIIFHSDALGWTGSVCMKLIERYFKTETSINAQDKTHQSFCIRSARYRPVSRQASARETAPSPEKMFLIR